MMVKSSYDVYYVRKLGQRELLPHLLTSTEGKYEKQTSSHGETRRDFSVLFKPSRLRANGEAGAPSFQRWKQFSARHGRGRSRHTQHIHCQRPQGQILIVSIASVEGNASFTQSLSPPVKEFLKMPRT